MIDLRPDHLELVRDILRRHLPGREVWVFGSRAASGAKPYADLDLAILGEEPLAPVLLETLDEAFDESDLPFRVDLLDWARTEPGFRAVVEARHAVLRL
ncbi:MAG: nucleotidyltransferase domain-containing protein [Magnetospirillum sp. WYHS-4]